ncbi:hypothetical protein LJC31_06525 [Synergistaceae bacterium OttesenSCG-928-I11]|nr:hypothetical protein [Synergistaceae bacterium OttesenSCG-928-I11]
MCRYFVSFLLISLSLFLLVPFAEAASDWHTDIRATEPGFLERHAFGRATVGYTDVVPPSGIPQRYTTEQTPEGYDFRLHGTELSLWQTADVPAGSRYLLNWHFDYEGRVLEGDGRTGFLFGNPESTNLLSVEVTYHGTLRLVTWGKQLDEPLGKIVWSQKVAPGGHNPVRIEADYSIRNDTLVCRVNGGEPITIELRKYMPSAPMTIRGVGFFSAVPEAQRMSRRYPRNPNFDIDLSRRHTVTRHTRLSVTGTN